MKQLLYIRAVTDDGEVFYPDEHGVFIIPSDHEGMITFTVEEIDPEDCQ